tara:strand:- start:772 stop:1380 length:609 start_codon:yes stop_codon:yes gene_type:complete
MTNIFTKYWSSGETLTANDLNANFDDVSNILNGGVKNEHLSASANIAAEKLADRFYLVKTSIDMVPYSAAGGVDSFANSSGVAQSTLFYMPVAETAVSKHEIVAQAGLQGHLMGIHAYVLGVGGSDNTQLGVFLNNSLIGQRIQLDQSDAHYRLHANNPFSNPLLALADKDVITLKLSSSGSGVPQARGLTVTLYERWSIGS